MSLALAMWAEDSTMRWVGLILIWHQNTDVKGGNLWEQIVLSMSLLVLLRIAPLCVLPHFGFYCTFPLLTDIIVAHPSPSWYPIE